MAQRISSPRFVGRAAELAAFDRLVERVATGAGCALMISGEAGIGKSRLVAELEARLGEVDARVLVGECVEVAEGELAFAPIVAALRPVMKDGEPCTASSRRSGPALAALWPNLGEGRRRRPGAAFEGVYRVLAGLGDERLVVNDCRGSPLDR